MGILAEMFNQYFSAMIMKIISCLNHHLGLRSKLFLILSFISGSLLAQSLVSDTFNTSGTFTAPSCVTSVSVQVWGAGGAGGGSTLALTNDAGGGGGGGGYSANPSVAVTPGSTYTVTVGAGGVGSSGNNGGNGGSSTFTAGSVTVTASGGMGGNSGQNGGISANNGNGGAGGTGSTHNGGAGAAGQHDTSPPGTGGGGGGAGGSGSDGGAGNNDYNSLLTNFGAGGTGTSPGGNGGNGGSTSNGFPGTGPGGGGGGSNTNSPFAGGTSAYAGGNGANGQIIITYTSCAIPPVITSVAGSGCPGSIVTITGTNLAGATSVTIGATAVAIVSNTATQITGTIANGTITGLVTVVTSGGTDTSSSPFVVYSGSGIVNLGVQSICFPASYSFGGITYTSSGTYSDTTASMVTGCDSITTITLVVNQAINKAISDTICANSSYSFGGHVYTSTGTYIDTTASLVTGCDSITTLSLLVNPILSNTISQTICNYASISFGGQIYSTAGTYADTVSSIVTGCDSINILQLTVDAPPTPSAAASKSALCPGDSTQICVTPTGLSSYLWSTGETATCFYSNIIGSSSYTITVTDANGCTAAGTSVISLFTDSIIADTTSAPASCGQANGFITVNPYGGSGPYQYLWSIGRLSSKIDSLAPGIYQVTVSDINSCSATASYLVENDSTSCAVSLVIFPTAFTPNGDGMNDVFTLLYTPDIDQFKIQIYDRWGQMIYESFDITQGWDGTYKGSAQPTGTYVWFAQYNFIDKQGTKAQTGCIELIR